MSLVEPPGRAALQDIEARAAREGFGGNSSEHLAADTAALQCGFEVEVLDPAHRPIRAGRDAPDVGAGDGNDPRPFRVEAPPHPLSHAVFVVPAEAFEIRTEDPSAQFNQPVDVLRDARAQGDVHALRLRAFRGQTGSIIEAGQRVSFSGLRMIHTSVMRSPRTPTVITLCGAPSRVT